MVPAERQYYEVQVLLADSVSATESATEPSSDEAFCALLNGLISGMSCQRSNVLPSAGVLSWPGYDTLARKH